MAKTVVTMTSWKKRIDKVGKTIFLFYKNQTILPDIFYLWLSLQEFPNKEKDLPEDLIYICENYNIKIKWLEKNEMNFKRWHVYPHHFDDIVISIDDDMIYDNRLVELSKTCESGYTYNIFPKFTKYYLYYNSPMAEYKLVSDYNITTFEINFLACSVIPPKTFPLAAVNENNLKIRDLICKRCDESWLKPFFMLNNVKHKILKTNSYAQDISYKDSTYSILENIYYSVRLRDIQLYVVLKHFPELMIAWKKVFPKYNTAILDKVPMQKLISLVQNL